jgi:signal recognition particle receptor subunit beta
MALFNYATKEITLKIVYYGPGLSGKTTNLQYLHSVLNPETKGKLLSLSTEADRTLFFDFLPIELGKIRDFSIRFQLYTVPGQVRYNATRKVVLKGADAVVFVADSQNEMREQNIESFANMRENLQSNNIDPDGLPIVLQYNKRDLKNVATPEELNKDLNAADYPVVLSSAADGTGVEDTFKIITKLLIRDISQKHKIDIRPAEEKPAAVVAPHGAEAESKVAAVAAEQPAFATAKEPAAAELRGDAPVRVAEVEKKHASGEVPVIPAPKLDLLVDEIVKIHGILIELKNSVDVLKDELKTVSEIKEAQRATRDGLNGIRELIEEIRPKKRWFRF